MVFFCHLLLTFRFCNGTGPARLQNFSACPDVWICCFGRVLQRLDGFSAHVQMYGFVALLVFCNVYLGGGMGSAWLLVAFSPMYLGAEAADSLARSSHSQDCLWIVATWRRKISGG